MCMCMVDREGELCVCTCVSHSCALSRVYGGICVCISVRESVGQGKERFVQTYVLSGYMYVDLCADLVLEMLYVHLV